MPTTAATEMKANKQNKDKVAIKNFNQEISKKLLALFGIPKSRKE